MFKFIRKQKLYRIGCPIPLCYDKVVSGCFVGLQCHVHSDFEFYFVIQEKNSNKESESGHV